MAFAVMDSTSLIPLLCLLIQSYGSTHFHFLKGGEEASLSCQTCQWEADVDSDIRVDCSLSNSSDYSQKSQCPAGHPDLYKEIKRNTSNICEIRVKRGFFACVSKFKSDACFIHPFKPSAYDVDSYIVAQEEPDMLSEPFTESSVNISEGGSINLTCSFTPKERYSSRPFVVHWLRNGAENSTSVYSCHFTYHDGFDEHCAIEKDLNIHNLMISNATHSDSGQYLCALQVNINHQQYWTIITNTTVTVGNLVSVQPVYKCTEDTSQSTECTTADFYLRWCVIGTLLIVGLIFLLIVELHRKKTVESKGADRDIALM